MSRGLRTVVHTNKIPGKNFGRVVLMKIQGKDDALIEFRPLLFAQLKVVNFMLNGWLQRSKVKKCSFTGNGVDLLHQGTDHILLIDFLFKIVFRRRIDGPEHIQCTEEANGEICRMEGRNHDRGKNSDSKST